MNVSIAVKLSESEVTWSDTFERILVKSRLCVMFVGSRLRGRTRSVFTGLRSMITSPSCVNENYVGMIPTKDCLCYICGKSFVGKGCLNPFPNDKF